MSESLDSQLEEHFRGLTNEQLARRMERAPDFGYDDEEYELNRRLKLAGLAWRWASTGSGEKVQIYAPPAAEAETDSPSEVRAYD